MDFIDFVSVIYSIICLNFNWGGLYLYFFDIRVVNFDMFEII